MNIIFLMIPIAICLGVGFAILFIWAVNKGQYDDLDTPSHRMLNDDEERKSRDKSK